jgi:anti-sigma B factor antagonist
MELELHDRQTADAAVVDAKGRIVFGPEAELFRAHIKTLLAKQQRIIVVNLSQVTYVDSGGLGALVGVFTSAKSAGSELHLAHANQRVKHLLDITRLIDVIPVYETEAEALAEPQRRAAV